MQLTKRLKIIASYVPKNSIVADIGTDHGYIPIYLAINDIAKKVYAMDVSQGPLYKAKKNIESYGVDRIVSTVLSDGLHNIDLAKENIDTIIISGMGGMLINKILLEGKDKLNNVNQLILSPHSDAEAVRKDVHSLNYKIVQEDFIIDNGKYYSIIICEKGNEKYDKLIYYKYGKILICNKNQLLKEYLQKNKIANQNIINNLKNKNTETIKKRIEDLNNEINEIDEVIRCL